jgi:hypothetical protein
VRNLHGEAQSVWGNADENGQRFFTCFKTVGYVYGRYRLVHRWVPATVLNVQSELLNKAPQGSFLQNSSSLFFKVLRKSYFGGKLQVTREK